MSSITQSGALPQSQLPPADSSTQNSAKTAQLNALNATAANFKQSGATYQNSTILGYILQLIQQLINQLNHSGGKTLNGTRGDDHLKGGKGDDKIRGFAGNDRLEGNGGNDRISGGKGHDYLSGGAGNDRLNGGKGNDVLLGGTGNDRFRDNDGSNFIRGGQGNDTLILKGNFDDYKIGLERHGFASERFVLSHKDGTRHTVDSVEKFAFNDISLSDKDLREKIGSNNDPARKAFEENKAKWEKANIDDYTFTLQRSCFCAREAVEPVIIEVKDGKVASARFKDSGEELPDRLNFNRLTVDDLFNNIEQGLDNNAEKVEVQYDPKTGAPTNIFIDQSTMIADEEVGFTLSDFQSNEKPPIFTTLAIGEEDGGVPGPLPIKPEPIDPPIYTKALGEDNGGGDEPSTPDPLPPIATTKALGEEDDGGNNPPGKPEPIEPPIATTLALGEEDGGFEPPIGKPRPEPIEPPVLTTQAFGEE